MNLNQRIRYAFSAGLLGLLLAGPSLASEKESRPKARLDAAYGKIPLSFEANRGQADPSIGFLSRGRGYSLLLKSSEAVFALTPSEGAGRLSPTSAAETRSRRHSSIVRMEFLGADRNASLAGLDEQSNKSNYFIGKDPGKWHTGVPNYARVAVRQLYPGIDLVYHGSQRRLEYDLVVAPGAKTEAVRVAFEGIEKLRLDAEGDLILETRGGELRQAKPLVYQDIGGERRRVAADYVLYGRRRVGFHLARHDATQPLVIDPVLSYSSYLGGGYDDFGFGIAVDGEGNAYVTGETNSTNFPITQGSFQPAFNGWDAFVTKIGSDGSLVYSSYFGGSGTDEGHGIAVDGGGNAYVTGRTTSADFPTRNAIQPVYRGGSYGAGSSPSDAFVAKFDSSGSDLVYSTYLGGSSNDTGIAIAVDSLSQAYVARLITTVTCQRFFPICHANTQSLIQKINSTGSSVLYSRSTNRTLGIPTANTHAYGIAVDDSRNAYVTGDSNSTNLSTLSSFQPANAGGYDAFVAKLDSAGAFVYFTYLGGWNTDEGFDITADSDGNAYVTGLTVSDNFPTQNPFQSAWRGDWDAFVAKVNPSGSVLVYSTYLGGSGLDIGSGIAIDGSGNAYLAGYTTSIDFPTKDAFQPKSAGSYEAFVTKMNPDGFAVYSSYLGTSGDDAARSIAVDDSGNAYITGTTDSIYLSTQNPFQPVIGGGRDAIVAKISTPEPPQPLTTSSFFTLVPCRVLDTRRPMATLGGPALNAGSTRGFTLAGQCGVPSTARALSVNVTVTQTGAAGELRFFPAGVPIPAASTISYRANQTRANNAVVQLGTNGDLQVFADQAAGTTQVIIDVNGYFQ